MEGLMRELELILKSVYLDGALNGLRQMPDTAELAKVSIERERIFLESILKRAKDVQS